ncbi:TonB family C-terminal domain-containing protein [Dyella sp. OK004]|uniref:TonB C-terminal domain-containing protein n=1 Tax=Dyella sp. OK004 TaxID=1855292 RepID=UPI0008E63DC6|nr:TonB C-terminal domain-containing protein [Dyella sp. OK004]SFS13482.1 TonB family C-terminal domain-containing protein [Dyella sp. OK004]
MTTSGQTGSGWRRWRGRLMLAVAILAVLALVWKLASHQVGVRREAPRIATITPLPPPPPPPKEKPPEPKKVEEEKQVLPKPNEPAKPVEAPKQAPDVAKQVSINGPAQAGNDSFNIGAGDGGGMVGSGGGNDVGGSSYEQYLGYALQQAIQRDERTRRLSFDVKANLWIDASGRITRVELAAPSGVESTDKALVEVLQGLSIDSAPPPSMRMPVRAAIRGRRPS